MQYKEAATRSTWPSLGLMRKRVVNSNIQLFTKSLFNFNRYKLNTDNIIKKKIVCNQNPYVICFAHVQGKLLQ